MVNVVLKDVFTIIFFIVLGSSSALAQDQIRLGNSVIINWWNGYETGALLPVSELESLEGFGYTLFDLKKFVSDPVVVKKIATVHEHTGCEVHLEINLRGGPIDRTRQDVTWFQYQSSWEMRGYDELGKPVRYSIPVSDYPLQAYKGEPQFEKGDLSQKLDGFLDYTKSYKPKCIFVPPTSNGDDKNLQIEDKNKKSQKSGETQSNDMNHSEIFTKDSKLNTIKKDLETSENQSLNKENLTKDIRQNKDANNVIEFDLILKKLKKDLYNIQKKLRADKDIRKKIPTDLIDVATIIHKTHNCPTKILNFKALQRYIWNDLHIQKYIRTPLGDLFPMHSKSTFFSPPQYCNYNLIEDRWDARGEIGATYISTGNSDDFSTGSLSLEISFVDDTNNNLVLRRVKPGRYEPVSTVKSSALTVFVKVSQGFFYSVAAYDEGSFYGNTSSDDPGIKFIYTPDFFENNFPALDDSERTKLKARSDDIEKRISQRIAELET